MLKKKTDPCLSLSFALVLTLTKQKALANPAEAPYGWFVAPSAPQRGRKTCSCSLPGSTARLWSSKLSPYKETFNKSWLVPSAGFPASISSVSGLELCIFLPPHIGSFCFSFSPHPSPLFQLTPPPILCHSGGSLLWVLLPACVVLMWKAN